MSFLSPMNCFSMEHSIWIKTTDNQSIEVDQAIVQQSNLLIVLQEKYKATIKDPIPIPLNTFLWKFLCIYLTEPTEELIGRLTDKGYLQLMEIALTLKCPIFYAQLMEQLLSAVPEFMNRLGILAIHTFALKKTIYLHFCEKTCIKKSKNHFYENKSFHAAFSPNGHYLVETISENETCPQVHFWKITNIGNQKRYDKIRSFDYHNRALFSPHNNYILFYPLSGYLRDMPRANHSCLYSITHDKKVVLPANYENNPWTTLLIHPHEKYIVQILSGHSGCGSILYRYNAEENTITEISLGDAAKSFCICFHPDGKHLLYLNNDTLIKQEIENSTQKTVIADGIPIPPYYQMSITASEYDSMLRIYVKSDSLAQVLTLQNDIVISTSYWSCNNLKHVMLNNNIACWNLDRKKLCLQSEKKEEVIIELKKDITDIITNTSGNRLLSIHKDSQKNSSTLMLWNASDIAGAVNKINVLRAKIKDDISFAKFSFSNLLLTQSTRKITLWDNQQKIVSIGRPNTFAEHPSQDFFLIIESIWGNMWLRAAETKLYLFHLNIDKSKKCYEKAIRKLTLSQALLFNLYYKNRKDKCGTTFYPNMPDGRALTALEKNLGFHITTAVPTNPFISKNPSISLSQKLPLEQS